MTSWERNEPLEPPEINYLGPYVETSAEIFWWRNITSLPGEAY